MTSAPTTVLNSPVTSPLDLVFFPKDNNHDETRKEHEKKPSLNATLHKLQLQNIIRLYFIL